MPDDTFFDDMIDDEGFMLAQRPGERRPEERRRTESHYHTFSGTTTRTRRHTHTYSGRTFTVNMLGRHSHQYNILTNFNENHRHRMSDWTGPNQGRDEVHTHRLAGDTTYSQGHRHSYSTRTSQPVFERGRGR